jgi:hypothetical protein
VAIADAAVSQATVHRQLSAPTDKEQRVKVTVPFIAFWRAPIWFRRRNMRAAADARSAGALPAP